jgi:catechol 2,3-dioxygenase-like lactoylglutathione lyase family enzyme
MGPVVDDDAVRRAKDRRRREDLLAGLRLEARLLANNPPPPEKAEQELRRRRDRIATLLRRVDDGDPDVGFVDESTEALLRGELVRLTGGGEQQNDTGAPAISVQRNNTILYCERWEQTVGFYRDALGLEVVAENDWFVEFRVTRQASISVADASRATIGHVDGQGITVSWKVGDVVATWQRLADRGLQPTDIRDVWDAEAFYVHDPEGHRIEVWAEDGDATEGI